MEWIRSVSYARRHMELVESGIEPLSYALYNETEEEKPVFYYAWTDI